MLKILKDLFGELDQPAPQVDISNVFKERYQPLTSSTSSPELKRYIAFKIEETDSFAAPPSNDDIKSIFISSKTIELWKYLEENNYLQTLQLKQNQLSYRDDYGDYELNDWEHELHKFIGNRRYSISSYLQENLPPEYKKIAKTKGFEAFLSYTGFDKEDEIDMISTDIESILGWLEFYSDNNEKSPGIEDDGNIDPYDYEALVANQLIEFGWNAKATSGSGDQGADVIAQKEGIKLV